MNNMDFKFDITDLVINSFPQIDETKRENDLVNEEKTKHLEHSRFVLYIVLTLISIMSLTGIILTTMIHIAHKDIVYIIFGIIFTVCLVIAAVSPRIFDEKRKKISYTYSEAQYEFIDRIKQFWKNINDVLNEETTSFSFINENDGNKLKVSYLKEDGQLYSEKFRLSRHHILFKDVPSFVIDFDLSEDPFISSCTNFVIPQKYYKNFVEQLN